MNACAAHNLCAITVNEPSNQTSKFIFMLIQFEIDLLANSFDVDDFSFIFSEHKKNTQIIDNNWSKLISWIEPNEMLLLMLFETWNYSLFFFVRMNLKCVDEKAAGGTSDETIRYIY